MVDRYQAERAPYELRQAEAQARRAEFEADTAAETRQVVTTK